MRSTPAACSSRIATKKSAVLREGETISYRWLPKDEFLAFVETDRYAPDRRERIRPFFCA